MSLLNSQLAEFYGALGLVSCSDQNFWLGRGFLLVELLQDLGPKVFFILDTSHVVSYDYLRRSRVGFVFLRVRVIVVCAGGAILLPIVYFILDTPDVVSYDFFTTPFGRC
ncbi:MAG: hypothetical protein JWN25_1382 [Verrucomicrobiales bacterium]|nr:hypothetical protein [Verrucomicrobiales bacterium]